MSDADLVLLYLDQKDATVQALCEAATYRCLFLTALELLAEDHARLTRTEQRLRQTMGLESWHPEG